MSADPPRNFLLSTEERIRALTIGPPAYALRKRSIEDLELDHANAIVAVHDKLVAKGAAIEAIQKAMHARARTLDLRKLTALVEAHNRYFPIEANLPMDRHGYLYLGRRWHPEEAVTPERLYARATAILRSRSE